MEVGNAGGRNHKRPAAELHCRPKEAEVFEKGSSYYPPDCRGEARIFILEVLTHLQRIYSQVTGGHDAMPRRRGYPEEIVGIVAEDLSEVGRLDAVHM